MTEDSRDDFNERARRLTANLEALKNHPLPPHVEQFVQRLERFSLGNDGPREGARLKVSSPPAVAAPAKPVPAGPEPLTTGDIAFCFDGLRWSEEKWKKPLGDLPKWLKPCLVTHGTQGGPERRWNPVLIGAELYRSKGVALRSVRARFQSKPALKPWLQAWLLYEAGNFSEE